MISINLFDIWAIKEAADADITFKDLPTITGRSYITSCSLWQGGGWGYDLLWNMTMTEAKFKQETHKKPKNDGLIGNSYE